MAQQATMPGVRVLETGNILFFYRPKQGVLHPTDPEDLERVYFMLLPDDQEHHMNRLFNVAHGVFPSIVPGKALPEERDWAFVQDVSRDPRAVLDSLEKNIPAPPEPSGQRARPWAPAAGVGRYAIARHDDHTHLVYRLRKPERPGEVQREIQIRPEASYIISVKEPYAPSEIVLEQKPSYPDSLRRKFDGMGWIPADPTDLLDYQYAQILIIGARVDVEKELGLKLDTGRENQAEKQVLEMLRQQEKEAAEQGISLLEPMLKGEWV
ncbi:MAG: hypothetical protein K6V36_06285 [Anaerolineae bacterium]|nr:hypothetical protein [Anaerolineae bacterium]